MVWKSGLPDPTYAQDGDTFENFIPLPVILESLHGVASEEQIRSGGRFILHKDQVLRMGKLVDEKRWTEMGGPLVKVKLTTYFSPFKHMIVDVEPSGVTRGIAANPGTGTLLHGVPGFKLRTDTAFDPNTLSPTQKELLLSERERAIADLRQHRKDQEEIKAEIARLEAQITAERRAAKKRFPTLADAYLAGKGHWWVPKKKNEWIKERILGAKRFVLDAKGSEYLGLITTMPELLLQAQDFAIQPFPQMWVEIDYKAFYKGKTGAFLEVDTADTHVGWLYDNGVVYAFATQMGVRGEPIWTPTKYLLNRPLSSREEIDFVSDVNITRIGIDSFMWGETVYRSMLENHLDHEVRLLRANHGVGWAYTSQEITKAQAFEVTKRNEDGELRLILTILLLLNRTSKTQYVQDVAPQRQMMGNKPRTLVKHHIIHFTLNPVEEIRRIGTGVGTSWRREHDVRGHFCRNELAKLAEKPFGVCKGITHDWQETDWAPSRSPRQWRCLKCGGLKWWKADHKRGHSEKGTVTAEYGVTAN